jgi:Secretion system C-terminal sorting domain
MKKAYIVLFTSVITVASYGQSLQRVVFNTTGGYIGTPGAMQMLLSVGEPIIGVSETPEFGLAQGFLGGSKTIVAAPAGIQAISEENATIYPNPFSATIRIKSDEDNIHVSVFNAMGQEVYSGPYDKNGLNLSHLIPGIYMVQATANDKTISNTKLLKQ